MPTTQTSAFVLGAYRLTQDLTFCFVKYKAVKKKTKVLLLEILHAYPKVMVLVKWNHVS